MPVLGHAFVGWGTALAMPPRTQSGAALSGQAGAYWVPAVILLAYAPDITAQVGLAIKWADAPRAAHSIAGALVLAPIAGVALGVLLGVRHMMAVGVSLGTILLHDLLDLLQTPERQPLWPFSRWHFGEGAGLIPASGGLEGLLFMGAFTLFVAGRYSMRRSDGATTTPWWPQRLVTGALVAFIFAAAGATQYLRALRQGQLDGARRLVEEGRYTDALDAAAGADGWPSTAHPGRVDHVRAEALEGLGRLDEAIDGYRRAIDADPTSFWALADLAAACAGSPRPEQREAAGALRARLAREFEGHPALPGALARIDRRVERRRREVSS